MEDKYDFHMEEKFYSEFSLTTLNKLYKKFDDAIDNLSNYAKEDFRIELFNKLDLLNISLDELSKLKDKLFDISIKYEIEFVENNL